MSKAELRSRYKERLTRAKSFSVCACSRRAVKWFNGDFVCAECLKIEEKNHERARREATNRKYFDTFAVRLQEDFA